MSSMQEPPITGDVALDEALAKVASLDDVPLAEHPEVLKEAQVALQGFLGSSHAA